MPWWTEIGDNFPPGYLYQVREAPEVTPHNRQSLPNQWGVRHGLAVLHMRHNQRLGADNVLLPDGTRGRVDLHVQYGNRARRPLGEPDHAWGADSVKLRVKWLVGEVEIEDDDIRFVDRPPVTFTPQGRNAEMHAALYADAEIMQIVQSYEGAIALYYLLKSADFIPSTGIEAFHTDDDAAEVVIHARGLNESYWSIRTAQSENVRDCSRLQRRLRDRLAELGWVAPELDLEPIRALRKNVERFVDGPDPVRAEEARRWLRMADGLEALVRDDD